MVKLKVLNYEYLTAKEAEKRGAMPHCVARNPRLTGHAIQSASPQILVNVYLVDTYKLRTVNMYTAFKQMLFPCGLMISKTRVEKIVDYYKQMGEFEAQWIDTWPIIPDIRSVVR